MSCPRGLETVTLLKGEFRCVFFRISTFLGWNMDLNQKIQHKRATSLALIPFCIFQIMCCIRGIYAKLFVSKFLFIGGQIRTTIILSSQLHLIVSVSDHSIQRLIAAWLGCHDDGWIIPRICSSSTCRQLRASVLETTSFLSQHEWQEAFSFRSEILSREHLFTSYFSFLVIVDTRDVLQPAFRTYISPYMNRVYWQSHAVISFRESH